jgi:Tfp pilus assembly protein PilN
MIKINLLPDHILESRRVKALLRILIFVLLLEVGALAAYVWAPAPFSVTSRNKQAQNRLDEATARADEVRALEEEVAQVRARYSERASWVQWVEEADRLPDKWVRYFTLLNQYIPEDVVINGLPLPSGNVLNLSGQTSDLAAAARWYLNMLRCEMVVDSPDAVSFSTATVGWPGTMPTGAIAKMQQAVSMRVLLKPEYLDMLTAPAVPAGSGLGRTTGAAGAASGGRMGSGGSGGRGSRAMDRGGGRAGMR